MDLARSGTAMMGNVLAIGIAIALSSCDRGRTSFDRQTWAAERGNYDGANRRAAMVSALEKAGVVPGAARPSVRGVLGEPDSTGPAADIYFLGRSEVGPSFEILRIDYDRDGMVRRTSVGRS
ncbi:hypothetical protein [Sphingosinicella sp. BN140058]|uniref:hypothetical protein n=1 Tax=Sphingosinicella sp. BN140058 TaxID=1892855 RepID=UPI0010133E16|nr:hypothetical protein [Sphingosinicella sp. BN140058]QAY77419.1 hypothetical protein ETR14_13565 [Sphingosinicella sp. BN140058]